MSYKSGAASRGTIKSIITLKSADQRHSKSSDAEHNPLKPLKTGKSLKSLNADVLKRRGSNVSKLTDIMVGEADPSHSQAMVRTKSNLIQTMGSFFQSKILSSSAASKEQKNKQDDIELFTTQTIKSQKELLQFKQQTDYRWNTERWIIKQNDPLRVKWDAFVILLAIWNSISLPIDIAFVSDFFNLLVVQVTNWIIDCFFIADIVFTFRTSY